jgi:hypothetical protein
MSGDAIVAGVVAVIVTIIYSVFQSLFNNSKTSKNPESQVSNKLDFRNKTSVIDKIDSLIDTGNYNEALKLCNLYNSYSESDVDILKRIKYIKKLQQQHDKIN